MNTTANQQHDDAVNKIIALANELKDAGTDPQIMSAALTTAGCIYATFIAAGNQGFIQPAGVDKLCAAYRRQLEFIQQRKKDDLKAQGHDITQPAPTTTDS